MKKYESKKMEIYWKICSINKNENIENIVYKNFSNIINSHRKKRIILNTLSILLSHIYLVCEELACDYDLRQYVFQNQFDFEKMKKTGFLLACSKSHTVKKYYFYGENKIQHRTLVKILEDLMSDGLVVHHPGYFCINNSYNKQYKNGYWLFNWQKFFCEIYIQYDELNIEKIDNYSQVIIKRKEDCEYKNFTNEYNIEFLFKDSIEYINRLRMMYSKMNVSLDFKNANDLQKEIFEDYLNKKRYEYEQKDESNVFQYDVETEIKIWNKRLSKPVNPYRLYHDDRKKFCWGRVYGNGIDSLPKMYKDSILKINDEYTVSIDVKSSILQFYILTQHQDIDNIQDFYLYSSLQNIDRKHLKILSQCLLYNSNLLNAMRAYNHHCIKQSDYNNILNINDFTSVYQKMIRERNYLNNLFLRPEMSKQMILHESSYMKLISNELMNQHIPHLCNFDAIYTSYRNLYITIDIFHSLSLDMFNKQIFIDYDKDLYNSQINNK